MSGTLDDNERKRDSVEVEVKGGVPIAEESRSDVKSIGPDGSGHFDDRTKVDISLQDLLESLSVVFVKDAELRQATIPDIDEIIKLGDMPLQEVDVLPFELEFEGDSEGSWCITKPRFRGGNRQWSNYVEFLEHLYKCTDELLTEYYRIFRIDKKVVIGEMSVIDPHCVGYGSSLNAIVKEDIREMLFNRRAMFRPDSHVLYQEIPIVVPMGLRDLANATQAWVTMDNIELRDWVERFVGTKDICGRFGMRGVYGENNVRWVNQPAPRRLSTLISQFPNVNQFCVMLASQFVFPECSLEPPNAANIMAALNLSTMKGSAFARPTISTHSGENIEDFRKILLAMVLPQQVQVRIVYDGDEAPMLNGFSAICAKLLLSTSPGARTIAFPSAVDTDYMIRAMLVSCGLGEGDRHNPLAFRRAGMNVELWEALTTRDHTGEGWVNHACEASYELEDPLYDGLGSVPSYGGYPQLVVDQRVGDVDQIDPPPIWGVVLAAVNSCAGIRRGELNTMSLMLNYFRTRYVGFLMNLNHFLRTYGETGFRLPQNILDAMEGLGRFGGFHEGINNVPVFVDIKAESLYKFFMAIPSEFAVSERVLKQMRVESIISAELQRLISVYVNVLEFVEEDGMSERFRRPRIFKLVVDWLKPGRLLKMFVDLSIGETQISRVPFRLLPGILVGNDDYRSRFFPMCLRTILALPELFGMTKRVGIALNYMFVPVGVEYEERRSSGMISSNVVVGDGIEVEEMTREDMMVHLNRFDLVDYMLTRASHHVMVELPLYVAYSEILVKSWIPETKVWIVKVPSSETGFGRSESLDLGKFTYQIMTPNQRGNPLRDQIWVSNSVFTYWKSGGLRVLHSSSADADIDRSLLKVMSYRREVRFVKSLNVLQSVLRQGEA